MDLKSLSFLVLLFYFKESTSEKMIESPHITDWGVWGMWENCPPGTFVTGMQLKTHPSQGFFSDDRGLTGIRLFCNSINGMTSEENVIQSSMDDVGSWGEKLFCSKFMTGFQLRSESYQGVFVDDTAGNNLRMFCDSNSGSYKEGDGTSFGKWSEKKVCGYHEAICGINTQIDKSDSWDKTGLNNVLMKCCNLPHPIEKCTPKTTWEYVGSCDNTLGKVDWKKCNYARNIGIGYADGVLKETKVLYEKNALSPLQTMARFQYKLLNISRNEYESMPDPEKSTKYYWYFAPMYVWEPEVSFTGKLKARAGTKVTLYQINGKCGILQVWGAKLKSVEEDKSSGTKVELVKYMDFTDEVEDIDYNDI